MKIGKHISREMLYAFIATLVFGFFGHMYIFVNNFVNWDGNYYFWAESLGMVESGRWLLGGAIALSGKFTMPFVIGTFSLLYMALGNGLLVKFFSLKKKENAIILAAIIVLSPVVTGTFTYMFTADGYFLAYMLSILAACSVKCFTHPFCGIVTASIFLCMSLGIYQAYGTVTIILLMLDSAILLLSAANIKDITCKIARYIVAILMGFAGYFIILNYSIQSKNVQLSEYQGIAELNNFNLYKIISNIPKQYGDVFRYILVGELTHYNIYVFVSYIVIFIFGISILAYLMAKGHRVLRVPWILLDIISLPIVLNLFCLISEQTVNHLLMKMSWLMPVIFVIAISEKINNEIFNKFRCLLVIAVVTISFFYYQIANIVYVNIEQRQQRTYTLALRILNRMDHVIGYYDGIPIIVTGSLWEEGGSFLPGELYNIPGAKGKYYIMSGYQLVQVYFYYLGVPFNYQWDVTLQEKITKTDQYQNMGSWPESNSMEIIDGVLVIKFP